MSKAKGVREVAYVDVRQAGGGHKANSRGSSSLGFSATRGLHWPAPRL